MSILIKGKDFGPTEQVTSVKLDQLVDNATFTNFSETAVAYTGTTGTCLQGGGLEVTSGGQLQIANLGVDTAELADDAVTTDKIADDAITAALIADNAINDANMITGAVINSGNIVTGAVDTNALAGGAVDQSKISFIDSFGAMTLSGTNPQVTFDDTDNTGTPPKVQGFSNGNLNIVAEKAGSDIIIDADDLVILRNNGSNILSTSSTVAKDASGNNASGAQVTGSLEVTQDLYITGSVNDLNIKGATPRITFEDTDVSVTAPSIQSFDTGNIEMQSNQSGSIVRLDGKGGVILQEDESTILSLNSTAGKNENGGAVSGVQVTGGLYVTGDVYADDNIVADHLLLQGDAPNITFNDVDNSGASPGISGNSTNGHLGISTKRSESELYVQCVDNMIFETTDTPSSDFNTDTNDFVERFRVSHDAGKDENGNNAAGAKVSGGLYVTGDVYVDDQVVADHLLLQGDTPNIIFDQDDQGDPNSLITGNSNVNAIETRVQKAEGDVIIGGTDNITMKTCDDPTVDFNSSSNPYVIRFQVSHDAGKDASGNLSGGAKVSGDLQVTDDINVAGTARAAAIKIGNDDILDLIHPVGSVIQTTTNYANSAAVAAVYGGTAWARFSEGRMLAGYKSTDSDFSAGNEDGSKTVTLTESEIPNINGSFSIDAWISSTGDFSSTGSPAKYIDNTQSNGPGSNQSTLNFGGGGAHDNMPPYKVVYMWTRTD